MIRPKHFGAVLQAVTTKEPDKPDAITSVGHPMTCLMKVTMSCTYKKVCVRDRRLVGTAAAEEIECVDGVILGESILNILPFAAAGGTM